MSLPANMSTQAATGSTTWARCCKIKLHDGTIIGLTEHDKALAIDLSDGDGEITYTPADAVELSDGRIATDLAIDNVDVIGAIDSDRIRTDDLHRGRYENADVLMFMVDWSNPGAGQSQIFGGPVGIVKSASNKFVAEVRSLVAYLQHNVGFTIGPQCQRSFGSTATTERTPLLQCGVNLDPPSWQPGTAYTAIRAGDRTIGSRVQPTVHNGYWYACTTAGTSEGGSPTIEPTWPTVTGAQVTDGTVTWTAERALNFPGVVATVGSDNLSITATGITISGSSPIDENFFSRGRIRWLTGNNAGIGFDTPINKDDGVGGLTFYRAPVRSIQVGDTFRVYAGCDHSQQACINFNNWERHLGHPYVPPATI